MDLSMADLLIPPLQNQSSNIAAVPNICGICSMPHYTGLCNALSDKIIPDKPHTDNLSRYSVPDGLIIMDCEEIQSTMVITAQKFAKGTRFGPLLAPKSYVPPSRPNKFPLVIFNEIWHGDPFIDDLSDDIKELFNVRNYYLDTSDENKCNWMIHVDIAKFSNEQNLMAYQENDQIYYTSTRDIELGDILKVWYSPSYASRMGLSLLDATINPVNICTNVRQVSFGDFKMATTIVCDEKDSDLTNNNYLAIAPTTISSPSSEISLPPVNSLMKNSKASPNYNLDFDNLILMAKNEQLQNGSPNNFPQMNYIENYQVTATNNNKNSAIVDADKINNASPSPVKQIKFTEMNETETQKYACELCTRKYITKSNLEKHMRSHDLFMCVVCMKMFQNPEELREHDCFKQKSSAKKSLFHCGICWKVLSNSWSLNRHMKIHRNVAITPDTSSQEKSDEISNDAIIMNTMVPQTIIEPELYTIESHCSEMSNDVDEKPMIESIQEDDLGSFIPNDPLDVQDWMETPQIQENQDMLDFQLSSSTPPLVQDLVPQMHDVDLKSSPSPTGCGQNYDKCIVCARVFKNPNSLDKHLKNVHTAHIVRPELTTSIKKSSEYRRIVLNKKPINQTVAKALVSKLNKKNQQHHPSDTQQPAAATVVNGISWNNNTSSLVPISSSSSSSLPPLVDKNGNCSPPQLVTSQSQSLENGNTIIIISNVELAPANAQTAANGYTFANYQSQLPKLVPISGASFKTTTTVAQATIENKETHIVASNHQHNSEIHQNTSPKVFIIDKVVSNASSTNGEIIKTTKLIQLPSPVEDEHHQCETCEKVFQKKYQLKRHQEIHENLFYFCPFCKRAPVKARSSLRKHFIKDHLEQQDTWQASNFMSTLLKKYEKVKKTSSHESHVSKEKKESAKSKKKKEKIIQIEANNNNNDDNSISHSEIINDQPLPQVSLIDGDDVVHQQQQITLSNIFLDPITLDEENNLIKYTLAGDDDFIMNGHNVDDGETSHVMTHAGSIESYEMSEFSNFKSSFDEIQEKLDAELHEFNNDQMIKWSDELNDDSSSIISSQSASSDIGKTLGKQKNGYMLT